MLEQKTERLLCLDMRCDAVQRPILLHTELHGCNRLALLFGNPLHLAIHLIPSGVDRFPLRNLAQQKRSLDFADRLLLLRFLNFWPVQLQVLDILPLGLQ